MFNGALILCLVAGLGFAGLATWLTTRKGNTLEEIAKSQGLEKAEAIRLEILDKVKLSSNFPIVGLYVVAAIVAMGLPALMVWTSSKTELVAVYLTGSVQRVHPPNAPVCIEHHSAKPDDGGAFEFPLLFDLQRSSSLVAIESDAYQPLTLTFEFDRLSNSLKVGYPGAAAPELIAVSNRAARLKPISLTERIPAPAGEAPSAPSVVPTVPAALDVASAPESLR